MAVPDYSAFKHVRAERIRGLGLRGEVEITYKGKKYIVQPKRGRESWVFAGIVVPGEGRLVVDISRQELEG